LVHRAIPLRHLVQRQSQVEYFSGIDLPAPHQLDQLGEEPPHRSGTTVQTHVRVEQILAIELDTVRHAHVAHRAARARCLDRLHHRLLGPDAFEHRVRANALGHFLDARYTVRAAFSHDVRRAEFARELLPRRVAAHRDDPLGTQLPGGEHAEQTHRAVSDDHHGLARPDRLHRLADFLDDAAVLVPHRRRLGHRADAAIGPQVRPAHTRERDSDDGIGRLNDLRGLALLEPHIARAVENSALHGVFAPAWYCASLTFSIHSTTLPSSCS